MEADDARCAKKRAASALALHAAQLLEEREMTSESRDAASRALGVEEAVGVVHRGKRT